jgi:hypothetical protein
VRGCRVVRPAAGAVRLEAFGPGGGGAGTAAVPVGFLAHRGGWLGKDEGLLAALGAAGRRIHPVSPFDDQARAATTRTARSEAQRAVRVLTAPGAGQAQLGRFLAASVAHNITWDFDMRHLTAHPALLKQQVPDS